MEIFDRLRSAFSEKAQLTHKLAELAGLNEMLVKRLGRHADMCFYPRIAEEARKIAQAEEAHQKMLRSILADRGLWPRPPENLPHEGLNNWERLSGDAAILITFSRDLYRQAIAWQSVDQTLGDALMRTARESDENATELSKLTMKCDPQSLD